MRDLASLLMTSSNGNIFRVTGVTEFGGHRWIPRTKASDAELWSNNGEAGDLRRHRAHYHITVMSNHVGDLTGLIQDCFLPKGSYAYPSSVIIFMKWNLYRKVPLCLSKQHVWTYKLRKVYCYKRLWLERNYWIGLPLFINDDTHPLWHIFRRTSK